MTPLATPAGTDQFVSRFAGRAAPGHFRAAQGLAWSSIGIGTYLGQPDEKTDASYAAAVAAAVRGGINVLDTAINYRFQRSERAIAAALQQLFAEGFSRDELIVCTKGGYLTPDGGMPPDPHEYFDREFFACGVMRPEEVAAGCHCISPRYLADQLSRSLRNLALDSVDIYYLHNPETQLGEVSREEFNRRLRAAFEFLEAAVAAGKIRLYGMATWNGFRQTLRAADSLPLAETAALAREVAGDAHHFRVIQMPFNLAMPEVLAQRNQMVNGRACAVLDAAVELGITVVASASLLQGRLARNLPPRLAEVFGLESDLLRALQFTRSTPGITTALVGMSRAEHVAENLQLAATAPAPLEEFQKLFGE